MNCPQCQRARLGYGHLCPGCGYAFPDRIQKSPAAPPLPGTSSRNRELVIFIGAMVLIAVLGMSINRLSMTPKERAETDARMAAEQEQAQVYQAKAAIQKSDENVSNKAAQEKLNADARRQAVADLVAYAKKHEQENRPDLEVLDYKAKNEGYSSYIVGTVRNNTDHSYSYVQVAVNLYDLHDNQIGSTMANVNNLEPHGKWKFKAVVFEQGRYNYKIKEVTGF